MSATLPATRKLNVSLRFFVCANAAKLSILKIISNTNKLLPTLPDYTNANMLAYNVLQQKNNNKLKKQLYKQCIPIIDVLDSFHQNTGLCLLQSDTQSR